MRKLCLIDFLLMKRRGKQMGGVLVFDRYDDGEIVFFNTDCGD